MRNVFLSIQAKNQLENDLFPTSNHSSIQDSDFIELSNAVLQEKASEQQTIDFAELLEERDLHFTKNFKEEFFELFIFKEKNFHLAALHCIASKYEKYQNQQIYDLFDYSQPESFELLAALLQTVLKNGKQLLKSTEFEESFSFSTFALLVYEKQEIYYSILRIIKYGAQQLSYPNQFFSHLVLIAAGGLGDDMLFETLRYLVPVSKCAGQLFYDSLHQLSEYLDHTCQFRLQFLRLTNYLLHRSDFEQAQVAVVLNTLYGTIMLKKKELYYIIESISHSIQIYRLSDGEVCKFLQFLIGTMRSDASITEMQVLQALNYFSAQFLGQPGLKALFLQKASAIVRTIPASLCSDQFEYYIFFVSILKSIQESECAVPDEILQRVKMLAGQNPELDELLAGFDQI